MEINNKKVAILLATYNAARFLVELLTSIEKQTYSNWCIFIRDDMSTDKTMSVIENFRIQHPDRVVVLSNNNEQLGAYRNFAYLLSSVDAQYYMFCDQDDIWLPNKIELSINKMLEVERNSSVKPVLVHTDMKVVDVDLNEIHPSFWGYSHLLPSRSKYLELIVCNCANGCTMLFNRFSRDIALNNVEYCVMHDVLLAISVAAAGGDIVKIDTPTVLYRQHGGNVIGATNSNTKFFIQKLMDIGKTWKDNIAVFQRCQNIKEFSLFSYIITKFKIEVQRIFN